MARMHPAELPVGIVLDKSQAAFVEMYHMFAQKLDDDFSVFFRCDVDGIVPEHDKPLDFVILHNKYGFLAVEVHQGDLPMNPPRSTPPGVTNVPDNKKVKHLPYSQIRMIVHSFIFGLKERGIRFYIPAPCCVVFTHNLPNEFESLTDADYVPLFYSDFPELQEKIIAMMPLRGGHTSNWSVPDAVQRIAPLLNFNHGKDSKRGARRNNKNQPVEKSETKIIYVVRAIDVFLAIVNIIVLGLLVYFMPDNFAHQVMELLRH